MNNFFKTVSNGFDEAPELVQGITFVVTLLTFATFLLFFLFAMAYYLTFWSLLLIPTGLLVYMYILGKRVKE